MPFTPLHLAVGAPVKALAGDRFSLKAFIAANVLIDIEPGIIMFFKMDAQGYALHGFLHTLVGATLVSVLAALVMTGVLWSEWKTWRTVLLRLFFGVWSHVLLDSLVHTDVEPFAPWFGGNPFYTGLIEPISLICLVVSLFYAVPWLLLRVREVTGRFLGNARRG